MPSANENVNGAGLRHGIVRLVAVDALRAARLEMRADRHRPAVAAERDRAAELVELLGVRTLEVGLGRRPRRAVAREYVHSARFVGRVVVLLAVDALRRAVLVRRTDGHRVAIAAQVQPDTE